MSRAGQACAFAEEGITARRTGSAAASGCCPCSLALQFKAQGYSGGYPRTRQKCHISPLLSWRLPCVPTRKKSFILELG